jgi:hypothetical protein
MEVKFNKYVYFRSLIKKLQSKGTKDNILSSVNEKIASASRRFIKAGKVTPALAPATVKRKGHDTPLIRSGKLVNSIQPTGKGITYTGYGDFHRQGDGVPQREFIAWYVDEDEKRKIIRNVKDELRTLLKQNLRKK